MEHQIMKTKTRYNWLRVDGKDVHLIVNQRIPEATGNLIFAVPEEYHEYLDLRGIELRPATFDEAGEYFMARRDRWQGGGQMAKQLRLEG